MNKGKTGEPPREQTSEHPFPLALVANIAVRVLVSQGMPFKDRLYYDEAADVAVRLLQACQDRLEKDELLREKDRQYEQFKEPLREARREEARLEKKYGNPVPFPKGMLYVTGKRSEKEAMPVYTRWLLYHMNAVYEEAESRQFFQQPEPPRPTEANAKDELKRQRREGFHPVTLADHRERFVRWHKEIDLAERKRRTKPK